MKTQLDRIKRANALSMKEQHRSGVVARSKTWSPNGDIRDCRKSRRDWKKAIREAY